MSGGRLCACLGPSSPAPTPPLELVTWLSPFGGQNVPGVGRLVPGGMHLAFSLCGSCIWTWFRDGTQADGARFQLQTQFAAPTGRPRTRPRGEGGEYGLPRPRGFHAPVLGAKVANTQFAAPAGRPRTHPCWEGGDAELLFARDAGLRTSRSSGST